MTNDSNGHRRREDPTGADVDVQAKGVRFKPMPWSALWDPDITEDQRDFERQRRAALVSGKDADVVLLDETGEVTRLFWQHTTTELDDSAYQRARHPPYDSSMERRPSRHQASVQQRPNRQKRKRARANYR